MCWGFQRRCGQLLIYAGAIVLLTGASAPRAAEPTVPRVPVQGQAEPPETMFAPADVAALEATPVGSEETLTISNPDAFATADQCRRQYGVPRSEYCRSTRVYRSDILGRLWVQAEYLAWAPKGVDLPALVTRSPVSDPADTTVLFADSSVFRRMSSGGRLTGGFWCTPQQLGGIEASYFEIDGNDKAFRAEGGSDTILARPFLNIQDGLPSEVLVAYPGVLDGAIDVRAEMEFSGAECLWRRIAMCGPTSRLDIVGGYRYARFFDRMIIEELLISLDPASGWNTDTLIETLDALETVNEFHGGQFGLMSRWRRGCWALDVTGKVALGRTTVTTTIAGSTETLETIDGEDILTTYTGGLLALPTNIGRYRQNEFSVMSELEVTLRCELTCELWLRFGYNLLTWSRVDRAADQIDVGVNPSQIPPGTLVGEARPAFTPMPTSFWAQGLSVGLEYQF